MKKIYRDKITLVLVAFLVVLVLTLLAFHAKELFNKLFLYTGVIICSAIFILGLFQYTIVDDSGITTVKKIGRRKEIMLWKDIIIVTVYPSRFVNAIVLRSNVIGAYDMVISATLKDYKGFVKIIYEKTKENPDIFIDRRVTDMLEKWNK